MNKIFLISVFSILTLNVMAQEKIVQTAGRTQLGEFAPKFAELNDDVLFGEVWSRTDKLGLRDRSLVTITSLISQGITDNSLVFHLQSAKKNGITRTEIAEIITHIGFYAGWPKAWAAFNLAKGVWAEDTAGEDTKAAFQPVVEILPGTVIHIPANVKHWHGAASDGWFAHLAFEVPGEDTSNEWLEPVTDEEYDKLK